MRETLCHICSKEISNGDDLAVVAHWGVLVRPYYAECYKKKEEGGRPYPRTGGVQLNSGQITWGLATSLLMWVILTVIMQGTERLWLLGIFGGAFVWMGVLRAYSYFKYGRSLL